MGKGGLAFFQRLHVIWLCVWSAKVSVCKMDQLILLYVCLLCPSRRQTVEENCKNIFHHLLWSHNTNARDHTSTSELFQRVCKSCNLEVESVAQFIEHVKVDHKGKSLVQ